MAAEGSGPGRNLSMEIDEMKDKMECMVELQSPPAQVIDNATSSHTESGKDKVKEEWMEKIQEQIRSIQGTNTYGRVEIEQLCPSLDIVAPKGFKMPEFSKMMEVAIHSFI
ncbi:hypothetical protein PIB30_103543 [Stylosanthes scabra]|uniref:Uncharacterized protein n=1 Tax=Stylosanthes scabra TaxID=79078 RepID=A0ABU6YZX5_9FABA|nr:hypothetical protein [Stylosanthes scabra]